MLLFSFLQLPKLPPFLKELIIIISVLLLPAGLFPQDLSGLREKSIIADSDTIRLDTLRIVPGTIILHIPGKEKIDDSFYLTCPLNSLLILNENFPYFGREILVSYRVFKVDPDLSLSRKKSNLIIPWQRKAGTEDLQRYTYRPVSDDIWKEETLTRSGSISRGVSFGNNQDVIVNSNLNLQLSGKLDDNINIIATISDQNIPLQPEGYSRQIHEFDKVFIQLYNDDHRLTAGDFEVKGGRGIFLPLDKKGQGIQFASVTEPGSGSVNNIRNTASAAISRGRFHRNSFTGKEGIQGPYKLTGSNNEVFIIVLAGSERVFVDGRLLSRGTDRDYTIDYNLAEITFTSNTPITKDRRIVVEFEYSDRNYTRFLLSNTAEISTENGNYFVNLFSEHDARNQPLMQELKEGEKELLSRTGDSLHQAWVPAVDSVEFRNDMVIYKKTDTIVDGITHSIYQQSIDPEKAHYRLAFSYVGEARGNYKPAESTANGRVFSWVPPVNGIPGGSHEPIRLLVTPKKHQVVSMGGNNALTGNTEASIELAISNSDRNTFSDLNNEDNVGLALRAGLKSSFPLGKDGDLLEGGVDFEHLGSNFNSTERFRPVEFERDWNLTEINGNDDERKINWFAGYKRRSGDFMHYRGEYLNLSGNYSGIKNIVEASTGAAGFDSKLSFSYLHSGSEAIGTEFLRHMAEVSRPLWLIRLGIRSEGENNKIVEKGSGQFSALSFTFHQKEVFIENDDTSKFHFFTSYREREDKLPLLNQFEPSSFAREFSTGFRSELQPGNRLSGTLHHRQLKIESGNGQPAVPENSINGRLENSLRILKGIIEGSGFYETGSGLEVKKDYMFIEVARGQGTHTWTDYNENGIKELDEFEPAAFPDQANYVRVMIPGNDFVRVRSNQFNQIIRLNSPASWQNSGDWRRVLSFFSNQAAFRSGKKTGHTNILNGINPFFTNINDTNLINLSSSLRNTLSFQPASIPLSIDYLHQNNMSKNLLVNGFDIRQMRSDGLHTSFNVTQSMILSSQLEKGIKSYTSGFFPGKNFDIDILSAELDISLQTGHSLQTSMHMKWTSQENNPGKEKAEQRNTGTEFRYIIPSKGSITAKADYYYIKFNAPPNSPVAWEMLQGLKPGSNIVMTVQYQQNLTGSLQMSLNYNGRTAQGARFIHTGGIQMRAFF